MISRSLFDENSESFVDFVELISFDRGRNTSDDVVESAATTVEIECVACGNGFARMFCVSFNGCWLTDDLDAAVLDFGFAMINSLTSFPSALPLLFSKHQLNRKNDILRNGFSIRQFGFSLIN